MDNDFEVIDEGAQFLFTAQTQKAKEWVVSHLRFFERIAGTDSFRYSYTKVERTIREMRQAGLTGRVTRTNVWEGTDF